MLLMQEMACARTLAFANAGKSIAARDGNNGNDYQQFNQRKT